MRLNNTTGPGARSTAPLSITSYAVTKRLAENIRNDFTSWSHDLQQRLMAKGISRWVFSDMDKQVRISHKLTLYEKSFDMEKCLEAQFDAFCQNESQFHRAEPEKPVSIDPSSIKSTTDTIRSTPDSIPKDTNSPVEVAQKTKSSSFPTVSYDTVPESESKESSSHGKLSSTREKHLNLQIFGTATEQQIATIRSWGKSNEKALATVLECLLFEDFRSVQGVSAFKAYQILRCKHEHGSLRYTIELEEKLRRLQCSDISSQSVRLFLDKHSALCDEMRPLESHKDPCNELRKKNDLAEKISSISIDIDTLCVTMVKSQRTSYTEMKDELYFYAGTPKYIKKFGLERPKQARE